MNGTQTNGSSPAAPSPSHHHLRRPFPLRHAGVEKPLSPSPDSSSQTTPTTPTPPEAAPSSSKKSSWISGITSKFSTTASAQGPPSPALSPKPKAPTAQKDVPMPLPPPRRASLTEATPPPQDEATPYTPATPKSSNPSFLQSALRRFSSSSGQLSGAPKAAGRGGLCERRVMNIDPYRERCRIHDLNQNKLRRVAFCVDVEIAGGLHHLDDEDDEKPVHKHHKKKLKEMGEGEALKHPEKVQAEKEAEGIVRVGAQEVETDPSQKDEQPAEAKPDTSKKKEKKKRSEEERKERKERKRRQAVENGMVPIETVMDEDDSSSNTTTPPEAPASKAQDHPTTDPLRIYRRCCQLRETPVLRKITDQLAAPTCSGVTTPGVVNVLDLSGYDMHLADVITLSDWLAIVPVKKLILEDCGLGDEAVRIILAALLACKPHAIRRRHRTSHASTSSQNAQEHGQHGQHGQLGIVEKLSIKNNSTIGREGWKHICLFLNMSRSLKAIDLSSIPIPQSQPVSSQSDSLSSTSTKEGTSSTDMSFILCESISARLAGSTLEELVMAECQLNPSDVNNIVDGASKLGLKRLGLAGNNLTEEGIKRIAKYLRERKLEGLDLGGNNLQGLIHIIADALDEQNPLWALSLADCNLTPSSLSKLFPALVSLPHFRFIELSHNRGLFSSQPNALGLLRKYLPQIRTLKRIHLADVSMTPEHAIALADIIPEGPCLAHVNILENPALAALASAKDQADQEEACALYASLMVAARVSDTIIAIELEVPTADSSEIVKALSKQIVAYCLWNMERGPIAAFDAAAAATDCQTGDKEVSVPDVLLHLVGHVDGTSHEHDTDEPAPDEDYVISGSGVVKALGICLGNTSVDGRRASRDQSATGSGAVTPKIPYEGGALGPGKAKDMSKNLLNSARKMRARLRVALTRERKAGNDENYGRLVGLDQTLEKMISRFEAEYPECRVTPAQPSSNDQASPSSSLEDHSELGASPPPTAPTSAGLDESDEDPTMPRLKRHDSDVSIASRAQLNEEGRMHRFGQKVRRDILRPQQLDHAHGTTGDESEPEHLQDLRTRLEALDSSRIREMVNSEGPDAVLRELGTSLEELQTLAHSDPSGFEKFKEAQLLAQRNANVSKIDPVGAAAGQSDSAIVD